MDLSRPLMTVAAALGLMVMTAAAPIRAQEGSVAVVVNGVPITTFDIPQRQRLLQLREGRPFTAAQALDDLINDRVKFAEARRFRVEANEAQVNAAYAQVASRSGIDVRAFDQVLRSQGIEPRVYRGKIRADLSWSNIVGARFGRTIFVTDTQLADAISRRSTGTAQLMEYNLRQVILLVPQTAAPAIVARRMAEANALRGRFSNCVADIDQVRTMSDAAVRDSIRRTSTDLSPAFRTILDQTAVGKLTPPSRTPQGIEMVAVCSKQPASSDDTATRNQVREEITTAEMRRISNDYLARIRRTAVIEYKNGHRPLN